MEPFTKHMHKEIMYFIKLSIILVLFFIESFFILQKYELTNHLIPLSLFLLYIILYFYLTKPPSTYLVDFTCFKPPNFCRVPISSYIEHSKTFDFLDQESVEFISKVLCSSGQTPETYLPPPLHYIPPRTTLMDSFEETHMVLFPVFENLLLKTHLSPLDIDILIVNCGGFCPSPSLSSIIINKFKLREDIKSFSISGMGCSASALCVDMAHNLLKVYKNSNAVILSTEILSAGFYTGKHKPMMILNCLFRMGSAAILLSNKTMYTKTAKYKLLLSIRTQMAFDDNAYKAAIREEDSNGMTGVTVQRNAAQVLGRETVQSHLLILGSYIFPITEKVRYIFSVIKKRYIDHSLNLYVPNFKSVINHFCLPTSGMPLIKEFGKGLNLAEKEMETTLMTFYRFGNQSSSSLWYELSYIEGKERVKKGEKVLFLGPGSGAKCTSIIWECNRSIVGEAKRGPWCDCLHKYPVTQSSAD